MYTIIKNSGLHPYDSSTIDRTLLASNLETLDDVDEFMLTATLSMKPPITYLVMDSPGHCVREYPKYWTDKLKEKHDQE